MEREITHENLLLGVDLGGTNVRVGLTRNGKVMASSAARINAQGTEQEVLSQITNILDQMTTPEVAGVGVGVPSVVDVARGIVYDTLNIPSWKEVPLKDLLGARYHVPVFVNNDANCFILGEKHFGKARDFQNAAGMVIGTGLGTGLILNGALYSGTHCGAGEFGCIPYRGGILEDYAAGQFFISRYAIRGEVLARRAAEGDREALEAFGEFGLILGEAVKIVMLAVDPDIIVLGGSVSQAFAYFEKSLRESLNSFPYQRAARALRIEVSEVEQVALLGAAALCYR